MSVKVLTRQMSFGVLKMAAAWAIGGICALPLASSASLVQDGSFESTIANPLFQTFNAGQSFGGWTVSGGSVDLINGYWNAAEGFQSVDLAGNSEGTIKQDIQNATGSQFHLTFSLSGNTDGQPGLKQVLVSFGGVSKTFNFLATLDGNHSLNWVTETWDITTADNTRTLSFGDVSGSPGYYGAVLDNVSLEAAVVPEPGTMFAGALLLLPFGASAIRILRRKRAA
jgi:choice-of-anchor C domain-containing protein